LTIELAQRLQRIRPSATVSITARAQRLREQGRDVIVLSVGEPDFPTPEHIKAAASDALARNDTKYTPVDGSGPLKEAIVAKLERDNGLRYTPEQVLVSTGAKQSCYNACLALLDAGDEAIVIAPYWVSYPDMVRLADAEPVIVETTAQPSDDGRAARWVPGTSPPDPEVSVQSNGRGVHGRRGARSATSCARTLASSCSATRSTSTSSGPTARSRASPPCVPTCTTAR
jgi:aspartate aminotransferase